MDSLGFGASEFGTAGAPAHASGAAGAEGAAPESLPHEAFPLSPAQMGIWFAQHLDPDVPITIAQYVDIEGDVDAARLEIALNQAARELGSGFVRLIEVDAQPFQVIDHDQDGSVPLVDLREHEDSVAAAHEWMRAEYGAPFDLLNDRLVRSALLRIDDRRYFWYARVHHIALDGYSATTLVSRCAELYTAWSTGAQEPPAPDGDLRRLSEYEIAYRQSARFGTDREYWLARVAGLEEGISLSRRTGPPAPVNQVSSARLSERIDRLVAEAAERHETSLANLVIAAFATYLGRMTGSDEVILSLPVTARITKFMKNSGGMVSNIVPLRLNVGPGIDIGTLLTQVRIEVTGALRHQRYRHEDIRRDSAAGRTQREFFGPLINLMLFHNELAIGDSTGHLHVLSTGTVEDLSVNVYQSVAGSRTHVDFETNPNIYTGSESRAHHRRFLEFFERFLEAPAERIARSVDVMDSDEFTAVVVEPNRTDHVVDRRATLAAMLDDQAGSTPDAPAVTFEGRTVSFAEFDDRVGRLARFLIGEGVGPERHVAVAMRRSIDMLVAIHAVVRAGGAYVPVDVDQPGERIRHILDTAAPVVVLADSDTDTTVFAGRPVHPVAELDLGSFTGGPIRDSERLTPLRPGNTAYVLFTSGSTGRPKGVAVTHDAIVNRLVWMQSEYPLTADDSVMQKTPVTFDVSVWELFWPLAVGARLVVAAPDGHRDPAYLQQLVVDENITAMHFVPSMLAVFTTDGAARCRSLRNVFASGEALPVHSARRLVELLPEVRVHNLYGPTEAAVDVTFHEFTETDERADRSSVPIGRPVWNTQVYVLDPNLRPVPRGVTGELYLAGVQLARGYASQPNLTADRFVASAFGVPGSRLYRTGDLVFWTDEGELEYVGRSDFQVKLRGQRLELGDIEAAFLENPRVSRAVAQLVAGPAGDQLVGYVVPAAGASVDPDVLRREVALRLPSYMVPSFVMVLDELPLNTSGKLDRKALPQPAAAGVREYRAPRNHVERVVADAFAQTLGIDRVGLDHDFFELGGNSLVATKLAHLIGADLGVQIPVRLLFDSSTVAALAERVSIVAGELPLPALRRTERPEMLPLSTAQRRLWFLNRLEPESALYNLPFGVRLQGDLDVDAMFEALSDIVSRHETLRTVFPDVDGSPYQKILSADEVRIEPALVDIPADALDDELRRFAGAGFDLVSETPYRAAIFRLGPADHVVAVCLHHIAADGLSFAPLARDILGAYSDRADEREPGWPPLEVQYADYTLWQRELLGSEDDPDSLVSRELRYWTDALDGVPDQLDLPADRSRPEDGTSDGARIRFRIPAEIVEEMSALASELGVTRFMVLHAALAVLLARLSGTRDIVVGTPVSGRDLPELDDLVGMFVNTLALRTPVEPSAPFADFVRQVRSVDTAALAHANVPFERLVEVVDPARVAGRHPLFQVALSMDVGAPAAAGVEIRGLQAAVSEIEVGTAKFDLQLTVADASGETGLEASFEYATGLFDAGTVESFAECFLRVLGRGVQFPDTPVGDIELLDDAERTRLLSEWNSVGSDRTSGDENLADLFDRAVASTPGGVAVRFGDDSLTYAELASKSRRLARRLIELGVGPESLVAVALPRSLDLVVALVAVVEAGGAYVPVDPNYPDERIAFLLEDASPAVLVTRSGSGLPETPGIATILLDVDDLSDVDESPIGADERRGRLSPANTAYVIYTSGSTGRPKGVLVPHRNVVRLMVNTEDLYGFGSSDVWTMFHSYAFDFSVWELWGPLLYGGTLVVVDYLTSRSPDQFRELLVREGVTVLNQTPSAFYQLDEADRRAGGDGLALRYVVFGGEALEPRRLGGWFSRHDADKVRLVNMYGITETTVHVSYRPIGPELAVSGAPSVVGSPIAGLSVFVLDDRLRPVPVGVPGEIYVAGGQLARGYLGRRELTSSRFVADPFSCTGGRLYRTGDVARWSSAGELEYLGRADDQVKIRGFRIELGEIEAAVTAQPGVSHAAVVVREDTPGDSRIVAYVVGEETDSLDIARLRSGVDDLVPDYMVPSAFVVLDRLPLTVNGKLDRRALPAPVFEAGEFRAPETPVQQTVASVFAEVLGVQRVGLDDDFFALGGNSLVATRVVSRIGAALDTDVPVRVLFEASSVEGVAERVQSHVGSGRVPLVAQERPDRVPLSLAQTRMWFLNRFDTSSGTNNVGIALRMSGDLDTAALAAAISDVLERHESLRTVYPEIDGVGYQDVRPSPEIEFDLTPISVSSAEIAELATESITSGFDVTVEVPVRVRLLQVADAVDEFVLVFVVHHIAGDGVSMGPLARDVMVAYESRCRGEAPDWAPLPVQYADFALWQRQVLGSEDDPDSLIARQVGFWSDALAGLPDELTLPTDRPRPAVASNRGAMLVHPVDARVHAAVVGAARERGVTVFMVVHAALAVLLSRLSGAGDVAIGTPIAGRGDRALDDLVGMFVNTLVLRTRIDPSVSFEQVLEQAREVDVAAFGHADVPFERLVEVLNPERSQARHPLFQVLLSFQNFERAGLELAGLSVAPVELDAVSAKFDLDVTVAEQFDEAGAPAGMSVAWTYATDLFDEATVASFAERFVRLVEAVTAEASVPVGDVDLLDADERMRVLEVSTSTEPAACGALVLDGFVEQVARDRDAVAVVADDLVWTYGEFASRVNCLARHLISLGVGPESRVAVAIRRSPEMLAAIYAVLTAGGAYVPVDPDHPAERTGYVLASSQPVLVLTTSRDAFSDAGSVPVVVVDELDLSTVSDAPVSGSDRRAALRPENTAYVIYTSGSTGRPKGVAVEHRSVVNQLLWMQERFGPGADDVVLFKTPFTFDASVWELLLPLQTGARLVVAAADGHRDPEYLARVIDEQQVTMVQFVPSVLEAVLDHVSAGMWASLSAVFTGGEALSTRTVSRVGQRCAARVHNLYGPTETTIQATSFTCTASMRGHAVPIGSPVWGTRAVVLDERLNLVPVGVAGELYLSGVQLARGYHGRADLTTERFVADPFGSGERVYRTGDLVRWTREGRLEYLGRTDFQVKFRGQRIELGEIEAALLGAGGVAQAAAAVHEGESGEHLIGYVVAAGDAVPDPEATRDAVRSVLPSYMVPSQILVLDEFPLNASGKLDRRALPEPVFEAVEFRAPRTPGEQTVAQVFAEVLGVERVGLDDDFFALGGNSLSATQVAARIGAALDTSVPVRTLFEASSVERLAGVVESSAGTGRTPLVRQKRNGPIPLSWAQQRMWFLNQFDPAAATYNLPFVVRMTGEIDTDVVEQALIDVIERHEALRTVFPEGAQGIPHQVVLPVDSLGFEARVEDVDESVLPARLREFAENGFDVTKDVPIRARIFRQAVDDIAVAVVVHHIAADGYSFGPLSSDVISAYTARKAGDRPRWEELPVQYADYSIWQRSVLGVESDADSTAAQQIAYWKSKLSGVPDQLDLPADRPRPATQSFRGGRVPFEIPAESYRRLVDLARVHNMTPFMAMHAAFAVLLARLSGTGDIAVGTPISGRGESEIDGLIGMFVNTLVLRTEVDAASSFSQLLDEVRDVDLQAMGHADIPFERLVEVLNPARSQSRHPLFQVILSFQTEGSTAVELPGLTVRAEEVVVDVAKFDLQLTVVEPAGEDSHRPLSAEFVYAEDLFEASTVKTFADRLVRLLEAVVDSPDIAVGDIGILDEHERRALVQSDSSVPAPISLSGLLAEAVQRAPDAPAVTCAGRALTYAELDRLSNRTARLLVDYGVGPGDIVAVAIPRSIESVAAVWAVARTGAAFVPVDPSYPIQRVEHMVTDSGAVLGVTVTAVAADLPAGIDWLALDAPSVTEEIEARSPESLTERDLVRPIRFADPAYVIYTSGSTGLPKGVVVTHRGLATEITDQRERFGIEPGSRVLHFASPSFDASILEFLLAVGASATMVVAPTTVVGGHELAHLLRTERVNHAFVTPAALASIDPTGLDDLETVMVGGEACTRDLVARWAPGRRFFNLYGPTETTIVAAASRSLTGTEAIVPIGDSLPGAPLYVLDQRLHPVPQGVAGELYVGGATVARGYRNRPALTAERFVADPYSATGGRLYRTGDVVRWIAAPGGSRALEFVGRADFQVKIRGHRIELGEIDAVFSSMDDVDFVATLGREGIGGAPALVTYVTLAEGSTAEAEELREAAAGFLPRYMMPSAVVVIDEVPLTPAGKLDRGALPEPVFETRAFRAPASVLEEIVAGVFAEILGIDRIGVDDDFFELGGNSLSATQVASRIGAALDASVPVRAVFDNSTVGALAACVESYAGAGGREPLTAGPRPSRVPLSLAQQRMWFLNRFDNESGVNNIPVAIRLSGRLDVAALQVAVMDVIERHESLRTVFPDTPAGPVQVVREAAPVVPDLRPRRVNETELHEAFVELVSTGFDVTTEVPVHARLFALSDTEFVLVMVVHHISADGWSMGPLARDVMIAYASRSEWEAPSWVPLPVQYADYALWQRRVLGAEDDPDSLISRQLAYWREALADLPEEIGLPTDRPRPAVSSYAGGRITFEVDAGLHAGVDALARREGATPFMVMHAALAVLLSRLSGSEDIAIGTPIAGRGEQALDDLIGMFVNTLVLRTEVDPGVGFTELLGQIAEKDLAAFGHSDVPFERLVEVLDPVRSQARHPLFQVMLAFQN
ncbi:non-ribosomal peptide synthetase, partial [Rhodococcus sp. CH91]|uniref:non-ribosomal peptide synthetase n=1 Tax=Rhodococcus sp. CH91 TaxID=2910256 RepID=UPI001F4B0E75